jgi:2-polyprenyl-3-methyl-5-hydroxy-6-metoxy-1,4-benzoquinol methylase/spore coat polysaccharide biosynthesis predicted glycosyltransferase SpsG
MKNVLIAASFEKSRGTGHLVRSAHLVSELRVRGLNAKLCIVGNRGETEAAKILNDFDFRYSIPLAKIIETEWDLVITDRYRTVMEEALLYHCLAPVLGIDEGGAYRKNFDFLLDILHCNDVPVNERRPDLAAQVLRPVPREKPDPGVLNVLVCFGGEDVSGLGQKTCIALMGRKDIKLTVVTPANPIPGLGTVLADFDLVITHYGITAYEALAAGVSVLLEHPSAAHRKLAKKAGFMPGGVWELARQPEGNAGRWVAEKLLPHSRALSASLRLTAENVQKLPDYIASLSPRLHEKCPVCGGTKSRIVARFPRRTYRRCPQCGIIYLDRLDEPPIEYAEDYFFDFYKSQYGRTYIEDFDNLKAMAQGRLGRIGRILAKDKRPSDFQSGSEAKEEKAALPAFGLAPSLRKILDIGCAYGPFLQAAKEAGFGPVGFDPAESAVRYLNEQLGIYALKGFFPEDCRVENAASSFWEKEYFDVVTMWYVIEHIGNVQEALDTVAALLKKRGVFAFSTPSCGGISGRKNRRAFLENSPADHWTVWDPRLVKRQLAGAGFKVKKIVVTGHHPERFPGWMQFLGKGLLGKVSRMFGLGDTFEVYAVKK